MTTQVGNISLTTKLQDVSYARGNLRFTADLRGAKRVFNGTLKGAEIEGTVHKDSPTAPASGTFKLRFSE